jgi:hypothetical protein
LQAEDNPNTTSYGEDRKGWGNNDYQAAPTAVIEATPGELKQMWWWKKAVML